MVKWRVCLKIVAPNEDVFVNKREHEAYTITIWVAPQTVVTHFKKQNKKMKKVWYKNKMAQFFIVHMFPSQIAKNSGLWRYAVGRRYVDNKLMSILIVS